jgi:PiT family inorganic phosphate transporter
MFFVFLTSGLFLGWSLGANDAANVYGTAVATRMIRFRTAAITASLMVLIGAVIGGAGATHTLGKLGAVNALAGSFTVALAAAITVTWMTKLQLPVSTSQAVVGAIIGWNFFSGSLTDYSSLTKIVSSWVLCPLLAAGFAIGLLKLAELLLRSFRIHLFSLDRYTRIGLFVVGAFASYSLGANNIANVVGVFVPAAPFGELHLPGGLVLSAAQQLFVLGGVAIAVGIFTFSRQVMTTVGNELFELSPITAFVVVLAQAVVLFLFASEGLESWLANHGLPTIPLVPVSSSQAVIGAVIGIGIAKGGRNIHFGVLGKIASGWISTPIVACALAFIALFIVQNVFSQQVFERVTYRIDAGVEAKLREKGLQDEGWDDLFGQDFPDAASFRDALQATAEQPGGGWRLVLPFARVTPMQVDIEALRPHWGDGWLSKEQLQAVFSLHGRRFTYTWQLDEALAAASPAWRLGGDGPGARQHDQHLNERLTMLHELFGVAQP